MYGHVEYIYKDVRIGPRRIQCQLPTGMIKKVIQQGRNHFDAQSVQLVREHGEMARTPLVAFFNIPCINKRF